MQGLSSGPTDPRPPTRAAQWPDQPSAGTISNASNAPKVQSNMIGFQKDGYRLAWRVEHGQNMTDNDEIEEPTNIPVLFAEITALLEDAHEIAVQGQNSKLERLDYLSAVGELGKMLDLIRALSETIRAAH